VTDSAPRRDPEGSRRQLLDAAERLFAARGYDATSLQEIAREAGLSRGAPHYFFGSKDGLYRAVLERALAPVSEQARLARERVGAAGSPPEAGAAIARAIEAYFDFLVAHPRHLRLVQWAALQRGRAVGELPVLSAALRGADAALPAGVPQPGPHWVISIVALCWFPLANGETFVRPLGLDPAAPEFLAARKRHIVDLVLRGMGLEPAPPAGPAERGGAAHADAQGEGVAIAAEQIASGGRGRRRRAGS
jgi:TetR/AcrR family transcriptional regulator